jgi:hypothetical protein
MPQKPTSPFTEGHELAKPCAIVIGKGRFNHDQKSRGRCGPGGRASLCRAASASRLALRTGTMCLGQSSCGCGPSLCRYVGRACRAQLLLATRLPRAVENDLPIV